MLAAVVVIWLWRLWAAVLHSSCSNEPESVPHPNCGGLDEQKWRLLRFEDAVCCEAAKEQTQRCNQRRHSDGIIWTRRHERGTVWRKGTMVGLLTFARSRVGYVLAERTLVDDYGYIAAQYYPA